MPIRRQGFQWEIVDLGNLPPKRLEDLENPQSIFVSGFGNATLKKRNTTGDDQFIVIQYFGSTPGVWPSTGDNWVPGGYVNIDIETTSYFLNPDGTQSKGVSGTLAPYPIQPDFAPAFSQYLPVEIPPNTNWDIKYLISNALVDPTEDFTTTASNMTVTGA